jgi:hypothetical protein
MINKVHAAYPYWGAINFIPALAIRERIDNSCTRWRGIFKGRNFLKTSSPLL